MNNEAGASVLYKIMSAREERSLFVYLPCLADAKQSPAPALVVGSQTVIVCAVAHREDLRNTFAAADDGTNTCVEELIAGATVLHTTRVSAEVTTESHCSDCYWGIDSC